MLQRRRQSAWMWVAIAAITVAMVARAQSGVYAARAYASPLLEAFAACQAADHASSLQTARYSYRGDTSNASPSRTIVAALLPVLFVGLLLPIAPLAPRHRVQHRATSCPARPFLFQRPPPAIR